MSFASMPGYLPIAALLATLVVVVALYLLRPPPKKVIVSSSVIWERVLRASRPASDRLRWWLSLLLALTIALAIASAALPSDHTGAGSDGPKLAILVDDSATMATRTTDGATRLEHALEKARALVEARSQGRGILIADTMKRIAIPAFRTRDEVLADLARIRVVPGDVPALALPDRAAALETVVITDGVSIGTLPAHARVESVFESVENVGITAFEPRILPADPRRQFAFVEVLNAGGTQKTVDLAISGSGGRRVSKSFSISARGTRSELIDISNFDTGPLRASIAVPGDGFALDDVAYAFLAWRRGVRVALVTDGNAFLEKSLRAQPRARVSVFTPSRYPGEGGFDVAVYDRFVPATRPHIPVLLVRPPGAPWLPPQRGVIANVFAETANVGHPLLENLSLHDLTVEQAIDINLKSRDAGRANAIVAATGGMPLIVTGEDSPRWVALAFGLDDSNFALQASFPVFLGNALDWMSMGQPVFRRGLGSVEIPLADARVLAADGSELHVEGIPGGSLFEVDAPGLFMAMSAHGRARVAANLLDRRVSDVNRSRLPEFKPATTSAPQRALPIEPNAQFVLLFAAILLLIFEWWSWQRRMTV